MKKEDILTELGRIEYMGVERESFVIVYGAALVFHGLKEETHDLDLNCINDEVWIRLENESEVVTLGDGALQIHLTESTDIHKGLMRTELKYEVIDGYNVQTIASVIHEKRTRGREKDLRDVKMIEDKLRLRLEPRTLRIEEVFEEITNWAMKEDRITPVFLNYPPSLINQKDFNCRSVVEQIAELAASGTGTSTCEGLHTSQGIDLPIDQKLTVIKERKI